MSRTSFRLSFPLSVRAPRRRWAVAVLAVASIAALPQPASAKEFVIGQCRTLTGEATAVRSSSFFRPDSVLPDDRCLSGGALLFENSSGYLPGGSSIGSTGFTFLVPDEMPNTTITHMSVRATVAGTSSGTGSYGVWYGQSPLDVTTFPNASRPTAVDADHAGKFPDGARSSSWGLRCDGPCYFSSAPPLISVAMKRAIITLQDFTFPVAATPAGTGLLDGSAQRGTRPFRVSVSDADSGVHHVELRHVDGRVLASSQPTDCSYTRMIPCPQSRAGIELQVDTTKLTDGRHAVELHTFDAAQNDTVSQVGAFTVANATPTPTPTAGTNPTPTPSPTAPAPTPTPAVTLPTPKPTTPADVPGGATPAPTPASIASALSFKVSSSNPRAGQRVVLSGVVTPAPSGAARIVIEAKSGKRWITAALVKTRAGGAYTWSHKFRKRAKFVMRARLLTSADSTQRAAVSSERTFRVR